MSKMLDKMNVSHSKPESMKGVFEDVENKQNIGVNNVKVLDFKHS